MELNTSLRGCRKVLMLVARWIGKDTLRKFLDRLLSLTIDSVIGPKAKVEVRKNLNSVSKLNVYRAISGAAHLLAGMGKAVIMKITSEQHDRVVNMLLAHAQSQMTTNSTNTETLKFDGKADRHWVARILRFEVLAASALASSVPGHAFDEAQAEEVVLPDFSGSIRGIGRLLVLLISVFFVSSRRDAEAEKGASSSCGETTICQKRHGAIGHVCTVLILFRAVMSCSAHHGHTALEDTHCVGETRNIGLLRRQKNRKDLGLTVQMKTGAKMISPAPLRASSVDEQKLSLKSFFYFLMMPAPRFVGCCRLLSVLHKMRMATHPFKHI